MKFVLTDSMFQGQDDLPVLALFQRSLAKRCYIQVRSPRSQVYLAWRNGLSQTRQRAWDTQLEWTDRDSAFYRLAAVEVVDGVASDWTASPPKLSPSAAINLVDTPFKILLENGRYDRAFLLAMVPPANRPFLQWLEHSDQLVFLGAGGLGELRMLVEEQIAQKDHRRLTHWAMFDSDASAPNLLSDDATAALDACRAADVPCHALERRALENYVPKAALYDWAASEPRQATQRRTLIDAFFRMNEDQRRHYHFKTGFSSNPGVAEAALFAGVAGADRATLGGGVHKKQIGRLFASATQERIWAQVDKDGAGAELILSLRRLIEILRVPYG
jgi:hypothetical protein